MWAFKSLQHKEARSAEPATNSKLEVDRFITGFCGATARMQVAELNLLAHTRGGR